MIWSKLNRQICFLSLLTLVMITGCGKQDEALIDAIKEAIQTEPVALNDVIKSKEVLVIIPRTGCSGCIGLADNYFKEETYDPLKVQFVFTKISSLKTLNIRMGKERTEQSHVYLDAANKFSAGKLGSMYPMIAFMEHGEIVELAFLSPDKKHLINRLRNQL